MCFMPAVFDGIDTLHVFVNHWPSKYGGALATEPGRISAAKLVLSKVDSIHFYPMHASSSWAILTTHPIANPLIEGLGHCPRRTIKARWALQSTFTLCCQGEGTLKFQGAWEIIDMMVVSKSLLDREHGVFTSLDGGKIFRPIFWRSPMMRLWEFALQNLYWISVSRRI